MELTDKALHFFSPWEIKVIRLWFCEANLTETMIALTLDMSKAQLRRTYERLFLHALEHIAILERRIDRDEIERPKKISFREKRILEMRYGLFDGIDHTLDDVSREFDVTRERIRFLEKDAIIKLLCSNNSSADTSGSTKQLKKIKKLA